MVSSNLSCEYDFMEDTGGKLSKQCHCLKTLNSNWQQKMSLKFQQEEQHDHCPNKGRGPVSNQVSTEAGLLCSWPSVWKRHWQAQESTCWLSQSQNNDSWILYQDIADYQVSTMDLADQQLPYQQTIQDSSVYEILCSVILVYPILTWLCPSIIQRIFSSLSKTYSFS